MDKIILGKPKFWNETSFKRKLDTILQDNWWSNNGRFVEELEGLDPTTRSVVVTNATVGLELALAVLLGNKKARVGVPTYTFAATASAVIRQGHDIVLLDSDEDYGVCLEDLERKLKKHELDFIIPAHLFGNICDILSLEKVCYPNTSILQDAAHCNGMTYRGKTLGTQAQGAVFSFHPTKLAGGFELGIYSFPRMFADRQENLKLFRNFGIDPHTDTDIDIIWRGTNAKANEVSAAAALAQLEHIEEIKAHYKKVFDLYQEYLPDNFKLHVPNTSESNYSYVTVKTKEDTYMLMGYLESYGIMSKKYFTPLHKTSYYSKFHNGKKMYADKLYEDTLCLPTGLHIGIEEVKYICSRLSKY